MSLPLRRVGVTALFATVLAIISSCGEQPVTKKTPGAVDAARLLRVDAEPGEWLAAGRDWRGSYYSPLRQIDAATIGRLGFAWAYATGTDRGLEATPLVVDGVMYTSGNWGRVYALDARTGHALWTFVPDVDGQYGRYACCDVVNRGVAVWQGRVYVAALDGWLYALDARSGRVLWRADSFADRSHPTTVTGAPQIAGDVVVIGQGGADFANARGYASAFDLKSGKLRWRFFTVPAAPGRQQEHPELAMAARTWSADSLWKSGGGGTPWDGMAYDPQLDLLYVGTGNGAPYAWRDRSPGGGDNLFLASILAIHPRTGRLAWYYQEVPGERWDYTATQKMILADLKIGGRIRRVLMQAPKNGFFYVIDRETGHLISARPYVPVNWASRIDVPTGRPVMTAAADYGRNPALVYPAASGGHNWQPMAFDPGSGLVFIPAIEGAMVYGKSYDRAAPDLAGRWNVSGVFPEDYPDSGFPAFGLPPRARVLHGKSWPARRAVLKAWDPVRGVVVWEAPSPDYWQGGVLATGGGLVFQGGVDGRLVVRAARTGQVLRTIDTGTSIMAAPMSYSVDGVQYVAVMAGFGGAPGWSFPEKSAAWRFGNAGRILAFRLDGSVVPRPPALATLPIPRPPARKGSAADILAGGHLFDAQCSRCHANVEHGLVPDLRRMQPGTHETFSDIVLGGTLSAGGMGRFDDVLNRHQVDQIHDYLIAQAWRVFRPMPGRAVDPRSAPPKAN